MHGNITQESVGKVDHYGISNQESLFDTPTYGDRFQNQLPTLLFSFPPPCRLVRISAFEPTRDAPTGTHLFRIPGPQFNRSDRDGHYFRFMCPSSRLVLNRVRYRVKRFVHNPCEISSEEVSTHTEWERRADGRFRDVFTQAPASAHGDPWGSPH